MASLFAHCLCGPWLSVMCSVDDRHTARFGDRVIAAVIGGLLGLVPGWLLAAMAVWLFGSGAWLTWVGVIGFGVFAFMAPSQSREFWGPVIEVMLNVMTRFYRR